MSKFWRVVRRVAIYAALALGVVAGGGGASCAEAQQGTSAENGIVGIAIGLTAHTVGAPAQLVVERVPPGGPAQAAGVQRGDEIIAIDGHPVTGNALRDITHIIRGKVGTSVTLTFSRKGQKRDVSLVRVEAPHSHPPRG